MTLLKQCLLLLLMLLSGILDSKKGIEISFWLILFWTGNGVLTIKHVKCVWKLPFLGESIICLCSYTSLDASVSPPACSSHCLHWPESPLILFTSSMHPTCICFVLVLLMACICDSSVLRLWVTDIVNLCVGLESCKYLTVFIPLERLLAVDRLLQGYRRPVPLPRGGSNAFILQSAPTRPG